MTMTGLIERTVDLDRGVQLTQLSQLFATDDLRAHRINVNVTASGKAVNLDEAGIVGYFIRADEETVVINGTTSGNVATLLLPAACYAVQGRFSLIVKASVTNYSKAIFWGEGVVTRASTDAVVDPGHTIPSLEELLAQIAAVEAATKAANTATGSANNVASAANTAAGKADTAAASANNAAGAANTAATQAGAARDAANAAASAANTAASKADTATGNANKAADAANSAASRVDASVSDAKRATDDANAAADAARRETQTVAAVRTDAQDALEDARAAILLTEKWGNVTVTVEMLPADERATVTLADAQTGKTMAFRLPRGLTGLTPKLTVGTVTTGHPGTRASASLRGTKEEPILDLTIPQGLTGSVENLSVELTGAVTGYASGSGSLVVETELAERFVKTVNGHEADGDGGVRLTGGDIPTSAEDETPLSARIDGLLDKVYPVGAIYISASSVSPETLFGGKWSSISGRFLLASGGGYAAGGTGGEAAHKLTASEMPSHSHSVYRLQYPQGTSTNRYMLGTASSNDSETVTGSAGGGEAHNNMPPYLVVYMWQRTS